MSTSTIRVRSIFSTVTTTWGVSENNRRAKYYTITKHGRDALKSEKELWSRQFAAISRIMEA